MAQIQEHFVRTMDQRVGYVQREALRGARDPGVIMLARKIVADACDGRRCGPHDHHAWAEAIFDWHKDHIARVDDPILDGLGRGPGELIASARRTLLQARAGDCDCQTVSSGALYLAVGLPFGCGVIETYDGEGHIYGLVGIDGSWVASDTAEGDYLGWSAPRRMIKSEKKYVFAQ